MPYEQPPPRRARLDRAQFIVAASQMSRDDAAGWERLLSAYDPLCTPALAREVLWRIAASKAPGHAALDAWSTLREEVRAALHSMGNVFEWRDGDRLVLCHLVELHWPTYRSRTRALLNELCTELLRKSSRPAAGAEAGLKKCLNIMLDRCKSQIERLESARNAAERADELRRAGETIYANLPAITAGTDRFVDAQGLAVALDPRLTAKENAAEFFRKYRKARSGLAAIENRLQTLRHNREFWEHLLWELERTDLNVAQRDEVHAQIAAAVRRKRTSKRRPAQAVRVQRMVELGGGAVALIGRSPADNERLTFSVARPQDYWFHARGVPGAHVIVKANGAQLEAAQVRRAAALAAAHSRADAATSVEVDYTRRKNVRRRGGGRTGLVWYTDFATIRVKPRLEQPAQQPAPKTSRLRTSKSGT